MSATLKQALLIAAGGVVLGAVIVALSRRRLLTLRYTVGWLMLAGLAIVMALAAGLVNPIAKTFDMTGTAVFLGVATVVLVAICIQLSITASGLWARIRELAEDLALMEARLDEQKSSSRPEPPA